MSGDVEVNPGPELLSRPKFFNLPLKLKQSNST